MMNLGHWLERLEMYQWLNIFALIYYLIYKRTNHSYRIYVVFLLFIIIMDSLILPLIQRSTDYFNLFHTIFALICVIFYQYIFIQKLRNTKAFLPFAIICIVFQILTWSDLIFFINPQMFRPFNYVLGMLIVNLMIFTYFYRVVFKDEFKHISQIPEVWLALGISIYFVASFPLLLFLDFLKDEITIRKPYFDLLSLGNLILSLGYLMTVIKIPSVKPTKKKQESQISTLYDNI